MRSFSVYLNKPLIDIIYKNIINMERFLNIIKLRFISASILNLNHLKPSNEVIGLRIYKRFGSVFFHNTTRSYN